jgi:hypothetical protein
LDSRLLFPQIGKAPSCSSIPIQSHPLPSNALQVTAGRVQTPALLYSIAGSSPGYPMACTGMIPMASGLEVGVRLWHRITTLKICAILESRGHSYNSKRLLSLCRFSRGQPTKTLCDPAMTTLATLPTSAYATACSRVEGTMRTVRHTCRERTRLTSHPPHQPHHPSIIEQVKTSSQHRWTGKACHGIFLFHDSTSKPPTTQTRASRDDYFRIAVPPVRGFCGRCHPTNL